MGFDIRGPIGLMFSLMGGLIAAYGAYAGESDAAGSRGLPVALVWGLVMLVFGLMLITLALRRARADHDAAR